MLNKTEDECIDLENKYGLIFISKENIKKAQFLFNFSVIPIEKGKQNLTNWNFANQFKHPFNAMVIADNYAFADDFDRTDKRKLIKENIIELLRNILPKKLEKQIFHLTIIVEKDAIRNIENQHKFLTFQLSKLFDYKIELTILKVSKRNLHDRNIITNYTWINSGFGFSLFRNKRVRKDTHLSFYPVTYLQKKFLGYNEQIKTDEKLSSISEIYNFLQKQFSQLNNQAVDTKLVEGSKQNRLLN